MQQKKITTVITIIFTIRNAIALSLMLIFTMNSYAVNMQYLKYSPVASFTAEDFEMLQETGHAALNNNKDNETSKWSNPESKNSGSITPLNTSTIDGMHCRRVKIMNQAKSRAGDAHFTFCKVDGNWKLLK